VIEFFNRLFGREPSSRTAKERLKLVLLSDHLSLAPDVVEALKHDLLEVISRYVEVDAANVDVSFEQREKQIAMLANIPILGMQKRPAPPASSNGTTNGAAKPRRKAATNGQAVPRRRRRKKQLPPPAPQPQLVQSVARPT
jgi:cell division topological specificity factor